MLACPPTASADWPPDGALVSTLGMANGHREVQILHAAGTDLVLVWQLAGGTGQAGHVQRMTGQGEIAQGWPADGDFINADNSFPAAPDGSGGAFDVFVVNSSGNLDVYLEKTGGNAAHAPSSGWGWPVATSSAQEFLPSIASDGAGGVYVSWIADVRKVYLKRFLADGSLAPGWPATGLLIAAPAGYVEAPCSIAGDGVGGAYVTWLGDYPWVQRVNPGGTIASGWVAGGLQLGTTPPDFTDAASWLFASGSDHVIAAWAERPSSGGGRVTLQRFGADGVLDTAWPDGGLVAVDPGVAIGYATVIPDGQGGATVLWEQGSLPRALHLLSNASIATGYASTGQSPLDAGAQYASGLPALAAVPGRDGGVILAWNDSRSSAPGVRVRWLLGDGTPDPEEPSGSRAASPDSVPALLRGMLDDGLGGSYVAWQDDRQAVFYSTYLRMSHVIPSALVDVRRPPTSPSGLALGSIAPNPAGRLAEVRFTISPDAPARIELLDLTGRRLRSLDVSGGGNRTARIQRLDGLAPGVYIVRLTQRGRSRTARLAILH